MQLFGKDTLANFNIDKPVYFGSIGNAMRWGSFIVVLTPFLIVNKKMNFIPASIACIVAKASGSLLALFTGFITYVSLNYKKIFLPIIILSSILLFTFAYNDNVFHKFKIGRFPVWKRTIELINEKSWLGYGIGTYKVLIPVLTQDIEGIGVYQGPEGEWEYEYTKGKKLAWRQAHNCWLQLLFEAGRIGFLIFIGIVFLLLWRLFKIKQYEALSGLLILGTDMLVHFPTRMPQSVLIMTAYLAYCQTLTRER